MMKYFNLVLDMVFQLFNFMYWLIYKIRFENFINYYSKYESKSEIIAILANGPSLIDDLKKLENIQSITLSVVNDFAISDLFKKIKPQVYTLADPAYFQKNILVKSNADSLNVISSVDWSLHLFVPYIYVSDFKKSRPDISLNPYINIIPFHSSEFNSFQNIKFKIYELGISMPRPQNVIIASIFNAINLNYKNIYLLGVDHNWTNNLCVDNFNRVCFKNEHFFNSEEVALKPFFNIWGVQYKMHEILNDYSLMFRGYFEISKYATYKNVDIVNYTKKSNIDSFRRFNQD